MEVTVKTLDSQTRTFQISSETTVKEFKKKIADDMGIPIEKQRLIFQGKVLHDEKSLQEYRVNGCVIHLVEKQPPRTTRSNGQSTETTTSSSSTPTTTPGNMFMGAFALPVDVMGVTQQIVQGIIQQIGAESAQANISTSSSDGGSSVNVHINLSTVLARNDARSRIAPARVHLNNVSSIVNQLQNDGMRPNNDMEDQPSSSRQSEIGSENNNECSLGDLADVLQQVVRLNDSMRPHLERYQELLRFPGSDRQLRPGDDSLPDLTAEALHSLSHAYHALSDLTTNFRVPEARLNVLPSMSPVPTSAGHAHARPDATTSQSQTTQSSAGATPPAGTTTTGSSSGGPVATGSGVIPESGVLTGSTVLNGSGGFTTSPSTLVPTSTTGGRPHNHNPFLGFPVNLRNLPNLAVQFNPTAGNITIAHIMTTTVEENSLRATTTTTNSTSTPLTSSRDSTPVPPPEVSTPVPPSQGNPADGQSPSVAEAMDDSSSQPTTSTSTTSTSSGPSHSPGNAVLNFAPQHVNHRDPLLPCQSFHFASLMQRPLARTPASQTTATSQVRPPISIFQEEIQRLYQRTQQEIDLRQRRRQQEEQSRQGEQQRQQEEEQQRRQQQEPHHEEQQAEQEKEQEQQKQSRKPRQQEGESLQQPRPQQQRSGPPPSFSGLRSTEVPSPEVIQQLLNIAQFAPGGPSSREFFVPPETHVPRPGWAPSMRPDDVVSGFADTVAELRRTNPETPVMRRESETPRSRGQHSIITRYLYRLAETFPMQELMVAVLGQTTGPYILTREVTRDFLNNDILHGAEATPENLQRATESMLGELHRSLETTFASSKVKDDIDAPATLLTYLRPKIRRLLELINSSEPDEIYATEMALILSRTSVELVALTEYCLEDGITGMEAIVRAIMDEAPTVSRLEGPLRDFVINTTWTCVRDLSNSLTIRESFLLPFVVRKEKRKPEAKKPKTPSPKPGRKDTKRDGNIPKTTSTAGTSTAASTSTTRRTTHAPPKSDEVAMDTDGDWKKVIPAEWVPVISQDIIRQRRLPRQAPFSDAYINGMPPKRRKIMKTAEPAPYSQCVSATLKRSIAKAGVTPKTDSERVSREASNSSLLEKVFEQEVKNEVRDRLSKDQDYQSDKFPSIHNYFEKDNNC